MERDIYEISGANFCDFGGFVREFNHVFVSLVGGGWQGNLDAFNDYLSWPEEPYVLRWKQAWKSRRDLGYDAMIVWWMERILECDSPSQSPFWSKVDLARRKEGPTLFEVLVEIIQDNAEYVRLELEEGL
jgi:hypothetical protein